MAMNKKEQAHVADLERRLLESEARNIKSAPVEFDLMPPKHGDGGQLIANGWSFNTYSNRVSKSCSSSIYHARGQWDKTTSQNQIRQFSTELLATKALRYEVEQELYKKLAKIDKRIAELKISQ